MGAKILTWDEIYRAAEGKTFGDIDLKVYDNARSYIESYAMEHYGIDIEKEEIPEEAIDDFIKVHPEVDRFNELGQMLVMNENYKNNETKVDVDEPTNYVLAKLVNAGIEVITDKEEFDRIFEREKLLQKMNLSEEDQRRYFTFDEEDTKKFKEHVNEWQKDTINPSKLIVVGKITPVMKILGISEKLIEVEQSTLDKIIRDIPVYPNDKQGHKLSIDDIYAIPSQLADPVMVFKSRTRNDSFVFFTERKDSENHSILIPLAADKRKGKIIIHEISSMYGKDNEIDFVRTNIDENNLVYEDRKRSCLWAKEKIEELEKRNIKDAEKNKSSNGGRFTQIQFLGQRFTDNGTYVFNILTKERLVNFISSQNPKINSSQNMVRSDGITYGFTHEGTIYLDPDFLNSNIAVHEYTHLWDAYTQKTNPELWNKGLKIFKDTSIWNEVINDENYADIKDDDNLVLSECHSRICGKIAESVLQKVLERDGDLKKAEMIKWDSETVQYLYDNFKDVLQKENSFVMIQEFMAMPMQNLFVHEKKLELNQSSEKTWTWHDYDDLSGHLEAPDGKEYFVYDWTTKEYMCMPTRDSYWDSFVDADPTRDTSLTAFKTYAEKYILNNIAKNNDIVFERKYIDTTKETENEIMSNETLSDKYDRMEKFFEGMTSNVGPAENLKFKELYDWVHKEFPEKDSENILFETVSRMVYSNIDFGRLEPKNYDDVYGNGDGADQRFDVSDAIAKKLIDKEISTNWMTIQAEAFEFASRRVKDLKNNEPDMQVTDRINKAFEISSDIYPEFFKDIYKNVGSESLTPEFVKKAYIEKTFDALKKDYKEKFLNNELDFFKLEALVKGRDAVLVGEKSLSYIRPNAEEMQKGSEEGWYFDEFTKGYAVFQNPDLSLKGCITPKFIARIDIMDTFENDSDAANQWKMDTHGKLMQERENMWIGDEYLECNFYLDTPENRAILKENGCLLEHPLEFDFSEFTESDFNKIRDELLKDNPKEDYYGRLHIGSLHVDFVINQPDGWVDTSYYILGEEGEGEAQFGIPYNYFPGHQFAANLFTDNTYEEFKEKVLKAFLDDIAEETSLKKEAMRSLVDWNNEQQCKELYRTKLVESARENEIVIDPYSNNMRDIEVIRDFIAQVERVPANTILDDMVKAIIDNIGLNKNDKNNEYYNEIRVKKDGTLEYYDSHANCTFTNPVDILNQIDTWASDHSDSSEKDSIQKQDYKIVNALYEKSKNSTLADNDIILIKDSLERLSGIKVSENIADEIYSRYDDHELSIKTDSNGAFRVYDEDNGKITNQFDIETAVKQVIEWNEKELSELHAGVDDEEITNIKNKIEELDKVEEQIFYSKNLHELNFENTDDVDIVKEFFQDDGFILDDKEAKILLRFATNFNDGSFKYAVNKDNQLYFNTNVDNEGWVLIPENDHNFGYEMLVNAFEHATILLEDEQKEYIQTFKSFVEKNEALLSNEDWLNTQKNVIKEFTEKLDEFLKEEREDIEENLLEKANQIISETFDEPSLAKRAKLYVPSDYGYDADNKIHILVEFDNNAEREEDLFNALAERHLVLPNGKEVDFNPIKPEKSGTIEEYLQTLGKINEKRFQRKTEVYLANVKVTTENFREVFNEVSKLPKFKDKPLEAAGWCFSKVPKENKAEVGKWLSDLGCDTKKDSEKLFHKWNKENNPKSTVNKSKNNEKDYWSISV